MRRSNAPSVSLLRNRPTAAPISQEPAPRTDVVASNEAPIPNMPIDNQPADASKKRKTVFSSPLMTKSVRKNDSVSSAVDQPPDQRHRTGDATYYTIVWRKKQSRMHKTWDGDGLLVKRDKSLVVQDDAGKEIGRGTALSTLTEGSTLIVAGKELEITGILDANAYALRVGSKHIENQAPVVPQASENVASAPFKMTFAVKPQQTSTTTPSTKTPTPKHNPNAAGAIVMTRPAEPHKQYPIVDVVVDPSLAAHLRPHQVEGVRFLYECVMGMKTPSSMGCILADSMGLGKTLQAIALIWTLVKQTPYYGDSTIIKKALIVCPASLVQNWKNEFKKWLGDERIKVFVVDGKSNLNDFTVGRVYSVLVMSYERVRQLQTEIEQAGIDIVVCDEGHRLKNSEIKTTVSLNSLQTRRKIILSGTPLQNDLSEFHTVCDFVNPGLLGDLPTFKNMFENPIVRGRDSKCTPEEASLGKQREAELTQLTKLFILRRTAEVNAQYLPPKSEYTVFCKLSGSQMDSYIKSIEATDLEDDDAFSGVHVLQHINKLRTVANAPWLDTSQDDDEGPEGQDTQLSDNLPIETSSKMVVVLVSNFTRILDPFALLAQKEDFKYLRLDGKTAVGKRQDLVDRFNNTSEHFLFLLSAKAGGVGLNLFGASRLILFDIDWNPAVCRQAMARIWRDGNKASHVKIYRLLACASIEEKIFQRQLTKEALSDSLMDSASFESNSFSNEELRDLFTFDPDTDCLTHEQMGCPCMEQVKTKSVVGAYDLKELQDWSHIRTAARTERVDDDVLEAVLEHGSPISFIFAKTTSV
ncbi:hypothetical protein SmJEL517_g02501 [Synchytrium microbalum]|uniref:DNA repair and recombination protein RAD54B n=1 Tax=Synchytrium microbalum TaxID=1806994 RepID=A0A507CBZ7_9FUNG|nr:uncharacterized protein SmJEL517_g02501 [Synchytrium microbalum]TPX35085.1 hypothetical protein SmJEL517_g02501 [Synchytrium microbalum]